MVSLATLRNYCAHHARVWNRLFPVPPTIPADMPNTWISSLSFSANKIYPQLCCIAYLLHSIDVRSTFAADLKTLLTKYPTVNPSAMGFVQCWEQEPLWQ